MASDTDAVSKVRLSLRRIIRTVLDEPALWPREGQAETLRRDLEGLLTKVDSLSSEVAFEYAFAIERLSQHMPDGIDDLYRGDLTLLLKGGRAKRARPNRLASMNKTPRQSALVTAVARLTRLRPWRVNVSAAHAVYLGS